MNSRILLALSVSIFSSLTAAPAASEKTTTPAATAPYREPFAQSFPIRQEQHLQLKTYVDKLLQTQADRALLSVAPDFSSPAAYERSLAPYRARLSAAYGTPPPGAREGRITKFLPVGEDADCTIYRVWIEVIDGVDAYGLYLVPKKLSANARTTSGRASRCNTCNGSVSCCC